MECSYNFQSVCCKSLSHMIRICVIPQCDRGNVKPFEAPNERLGVSGRLVSWGPLIRPIGSKTLYQLRKASRTPELQAPLPGRSLYGTRSSHSVYMQKYPRKGRRGAEASNIRPCITKRTYSDTPKLNSNDVRRYLYPR
jgi:hypothetical protein